MQTSALSSHSPYPGEAPSGARRPWAALAAGLLWLAAGLSAGYWGLAVMGRSPATPVAATPQPVPAADPATVAHALGARDAPAGAPEPNPAPVAAAPARYALLGVVAAGGRGGAALIAVGDQPARPFRVGATVDAGLVLQAVERRAVRLGPSVSGPTTVELALPEPAALPS
jgi:general secretion pathway protein C